jgi:hypothetical protein
MRPTDAEALANARSDLLRAGVTDRQIATRVTRGILNRVVAGTYVGSAEWSAAYSEQRHLVRVFAAERRMRGTGATVSHISAGALHGLPLFRTDPDRVHVSAAQMNGNVGAPGLAVARHRVAVPDADLTVIDGIRCTSLPRTVADVLRSTSPETSIAMADAALRQVAWDDRRRSYDVDAAERFRTDVRTSLPVGGRGVRQARYILDLADGRSQLPGESTSRLYLVRLGYEQIRLQVPIAGPSGRDYAIDLALDDVRTFVEFDGLGKYLAQDDRGTPGVLLDEKAREDWIRGTTGWAVVRWGMEHIASVDTLRRRLRAFHVPLPPR